MDKKYVQKVIPKVYTKRYRKLSSYDLRKESVRLAIIARKDGTFYYNVEVDLGRESTK